MPFIAFTVNLNSISNPFVYVLRNGKYRLQLFRRRRTAPNDNNIETRQNKGRKPSNGVKNQPSTDSDDYNKEIKARQNRADSNGENYSQSSSTGTNEENEISHDDDPILIKNEGKQFSDDTESDLRDIESFQSNNADATITGTGVTAPVSPNRSPRKVILVTRCQF